MSELFSREFKGYYKTTGVYAWRRLHKALRAFRRELMAVVEPPILWVLRLLSRRPS